MTTIGFHSDRTRPQKQNADMTMSLGDGLFPPFRTGVHLLLVLIVLGTMIGLPVEIMAESNYQKQCSDGIYCSLTTISPAFHSNVLNFTEDDQGNTSDERTPVTTRSKSHLATAQIGVKLGANKSRHYGKDIDTLDADFEDLRGYGAGIFSAFMMNRFALIQSEILYQQKGALYRHGDQEIVERLTYLELPILFKLLLTDWMVKPHLLFGPYMAILLTAKLEGDFTDEDIIRDTNRGDAGYIIGMGIDLTLDRTIMSMDIRYCQGFIDVFDDIARNESVIVTIGYYIH